MRYTLNKAFDSIEQTMIRNIANSLFQLEFHRNATPEQLVEYYGWTEAFEENEREKLVDDTLVRLASEQLVLRTYQGMKLTLKKTYGKKDAWGDLDLPVQRSAGSSDQPGSVDTHTEDHEAGDDHHHEGRHDHDAADHDHSGEQARGDGSGDGPRPSEADSVRGDDEGRS